MKLRSFSAHEVPFAPPLNLQVWGKQRLAFIETSYRRIRPTFRLLSLRPFRLQLWESFYEPQCVILRLPEGEEAFNLRSWTKLAELPASLKLVEDWHSDGKVDLVLERRVIHGPFGKPLLTSSYASPYKISSTLYLACVDGSKIRWSKLVPPSSANLVYTLPIQIPNGVALFVLWQAGDKTILERIRWQTAK
ncbi:MAG: hypothetical protein NZ805_07255 [Armatimonadetes bacterium]|nr:hypothetical protein [Armatimonadota bacterium]